VVHKFPLQQDEMRRLVHLLGLIAAFRLVQIFLPALQFPVSVSEFTILGLRIAQTVLAVLLMLAASKFLHRYLQMVVEKTETKTDDQLLPIGIKLLKAGIILFGLFHALSLMNVNVTAIIAGVSIGGLALALAAQETIKNFIGSLMIIIDKPFQVGDYIATGDLEGTVTEVGFRTSRIMMIDTSIISIPNGQLADSRVTNLGVRPMRMISMNLGVMYNTPPDKIEEFIEGIKAIVFEHPVMADEPLYVHLREFANSSINVFFRGYIKVLTFPEELVIREQVMFSILRLARRIGVSFAFPSTSIYVEQMPKKE
jgi:MscS family membrane protein